MISGSSFALTVMPSALVQVQHLRSFVTVSPVKKAHIKHLRTSSVLRTPDFSSSNPSTSSREKSSNASLISLSCSFVMLFSLARRVSFGFGAAFAASATFLFGACHDLILARDSL